jgi:hypothetical protein
MKTSFTFGVNFSFRLSDPSEVTEIYDDNTGKLFFPVIF